MKKSSFILLLSLYCLPLCSQVVTVNDFLNLTTVSDKRLNSYMSKMSFAPMGRTLEDGSTVSEYVYRNKKNPYDSTLRFISGYKNGKNSGVIYNTSSFTEYYSLLRQFQMIGFIKGGKQDSANIKQDSVVTTSLDSGLTRMDSIRINSMLANSIPIDVDSTAAIDTTNFFQKGDMVVRIGEEMRDEVRVFRIRLEKRPVPTGSSVKFADDLLNFDSHQALIAMFGKDNVKRRYYMFTPQDSVYCSVIYINTDRQAIFLWEDQPNWRTLTFLIVGGSLKAYDDPEDQVQGMKLNAWHSASGLYVGMRISEVLRINDADFNVFGYRSEFAMMTVPEKKGNIDFKQGGAVFACLNCRGESMMQKEKISAQAALDARLQLFINSLVFMPADR